MTEKIYKSFGYNARNYGLVNAVTASFNTYGTNHRNVSTKQQF